MPIAVPNRTRTLPRPHAPRRGRAVHVSGGVGASLSQILGGWSFAVRIWVAFEPPTSSSPTWIEVTQFIDMDQPITITWGRVDGVSDVNAATLSLTADNSDGRWCASNPSGAWYGLIRKGAWIKVDEIPLSGTLSNRYVGFINNLPTTWTGQYASSQIGASDRFERIGQEPAIISSVQSEVLTDPSVAGTVLGYWNLHEASVAQGGRITFGDTSGQGAAPMTLYTTGGVPNGTGFAAANADGPGFDGTRCVTFNPPNGAFATAGSYLAAPVTSPTPGTFNLSTGAYSGLYATVELWFQATNSVQGMLFSLIDWGDQFSSVVLYEQGHVLISSGITSAANPILFTDFFVAAPRGRVDDGAWHHLIVGTACTSAGGGWLNQVAVLDGQYVATGASNGGGGTCGMNFTQLSVGAAATTGLSSTNWEFGAANISDVAYYWADLSGYTNTPPDAASHYAAGVTGFYGESTDNRIARIARYAGVPIPLTAVSSGLLPGSVKRYAAGSSGPWTNLSTGAHYCGTQAMGGRAHLDVMREAGRTENQPLFVDRNGNLAIQPSTIRQNTTPAWTVDSRDLDSSTGLADDFAYTTNVATITPNGQATQTVVGAPGSPGALSQAKYGVYSNGGSLSTASITPLEAQNLGLAVIAPRADPAPRWSPLVVEAATLATQAGYGAAWFDAVLATTVSTPVRVTSLPAAAGSGLVDVLIEGGTETITGGQQVFSFSVSPIQTPSYQLDSPSLGLLDTAGISLAY